MNVLQGFEEISLLDDSPNFQDSFFFSIQEEHQLLWFAAAVDSSNIFLYQLIVRRLQFNLILYQNYRNKILSAVKQ